MNKFLSVAFCTALLTGCGGIIERPVHVKTEIRTYEILDVDPPKHVYVDLKDIETGQRHNRVFVSKHFNNWREKLIIGRKVQVRRSTYKDSKGQFIEFNGLREDLDN